jgi:hypothetical protein
MSAYGLSGIASDDGSNKEDPIMDNPLIGATVPKQFDRTVATLSR